MSASLEPEHHHHTKVVFYVDGERIEVHTHELTVREILDVAGLDPNDHYLVELRGHDRIEYKDLNQTLNLHEHERFCSVYHGQTPVG